MFLKRRAEEGILRCSFCGKTEEQVDALISNPTDPTKRVCICSDCVAVCNSVLREHKGAKAAGAN